MKFSSIQTKSIMVFAMIFTIALLRCYSQDDSYNYIEPTDAGPGNFGLKLGYGSANISEWPYSGKDALNTIPAFNVSIYFSMNPLVGKYIEFTQELGYVSKGFSVKNMYPADGETDFSLGYAELNNIIKIKPLKTRIAPFIFGGFYLSALVKGGDNLNKYISDNFYPNNMMDAPNCKAFDYGFNYGAGIDFGRMEHGKNERWGGFDLRVSQGMISILEGTEPPPVDLKNQVTMFVFRLYLFNL